MSTYNTNRSFLYKNCENKCKNVINLTLNHQYIFIIYLTSMLYHCCAYWVTHGYAVWSTPNTNIFCIFNVPSKTQTRKQMKVHYKNWSCATSMRWCTIFNADELDLSCTFSENVSELKDIFVHNLLNLISTGKWFWYNPWLKSIKMISNGPSV